MSELLDGGSGSASYAFPSAARAGSARPEATLAKKWHTTERTRNRCLVGFNEHINKLSVYTHCKQDGSNCPTNEIERL